MAFKDDLDTVLTYVVDAVKTVFPGETVSKEEPQKVNSLPYIQVTMLDARMESLNVSQDACEISVRVQRAVGETDGASITAAIDAMADLRDELVGTAHPGGVGMQPMVPEIVFPFGPDQLDERVEMGLVFTCGIKVAR